VLNNTQPYNFTATSMNSCAQQLPIEPLHIHNLVLYGKLAVQQRLDCLHTTTTTTTPHTHTHLQKADDCVCTLQLVLSLRFVSLQLTDAGSELVNAALEAAAVAAAAGAA
jgi:hypothetical protein